MPSEVEEIMSLVEASDKYGMNELKNKSLRFLISQITMDNVGKITILAYLHNADLVIQEELRNYCKR